MTFFVRHVRSVTVLLVIAIIVMFTCISSSWAEFSSGQNKPIKIVTVVHCDYSPVSFWDTNTDMPSGFFVDIMDSVAGRAGLQVTYICKNGWPEMINAIESGEADVGALLKSEERENRLLFSTPIDITYLSFFARSQSSVDGERVPQGHTVGVIKGSMSHEQLKNRPGVRLLMYGSYQEGLFGLLAGEISLFAGEESMILKRARETHLEDRIKRAGKPFLERERGLAVKKDNVQLLEQLNKALSGFAESPEYQRIYLKWYGAPTPYWTGRRILTASGIFLFIVVCGMALWRYLSLSKIHKNLIQQITERKQAEEALRESKDQFRKVVENSPLSMALVNSDGVIEYVNLKAIETFGYLPQDIPNMDRWWVQAYPDKTYRDEVIAQWRGLVGEALTHNHEIEQREYHVTCKNGSVKVTTIFGVWIADKVLVVFDDITERKRAGELIRSSLLEKEILLKEIHHRVKNNLQVVASMLHLQAGYIKDREARTSFEESQKRVESMALLHEKLYRAKDLARIDFREYVADLVESLLTLNTDKASRIEMKLDIEGVMLDINNSIPCGLIINELISNALAHAFPEGRKGKIDISMHSSSDNRIRLSVSDNGIGFPEDLDFRNTASLGMQLVNSLVRQLGGLIELDRSEGTAFRIEFQA